MLERYTVQGRIDALRRLGFHKLAMELGPAGLPGAHAPLSPHGAAALARGGAGGGRFAVPAPAAPAAAAPPAGGGGGVDVGGFFNKQWGAAKDLYGNLRQGLGGAENAAAGAAARQGAVGNLKTLAPTLAAGGALYLMHAHNEAKRKNEARQRAMMMGGGY